MRKLTAIFTRFPALLACLVLSSCFDIREELWVKSDGSARAELTYVVPDSALFLTSGAEGLEAKIRELIGKQPELRLDDVSVTVANERATVALKVSTDSLYSLRKLKRREGMDELPSSAADIAGKFEVKRSGLTIDFSRTVKVREALGLGALAVGADDRATRRLTYIVHLPYAAKESNAMIVEDGGKTLKWDSSLGDALKSPLITRFQARMPIPPTVVYAGGLIALAILALGWRVVSLRRRRAGARQTEASAA